MKTIAIILFGLVVLTASGVARAWDGPGMWYQAATGGPGGAAGPGGGGIVGTGGASDHNVTCAHCHIKGADGYGSIVLTPTFNPPIGATYELGKTYEVTVTLANEHLGKSNCGADMKNTNEFAATFEDDSGKPVGALKAAYGSAASCPRAEPTGDPAPDTFTYSDCRAVFGRGADGATTWTFSWTAPAQATPVTMYFAGVDGDCMMNSIGDDAYVGTMKLGGGVAMREPQSNRVFACVGLFPIIGFFAAARRRKA
jgi:hypothetical protein